jgi:biotin carboxyl carrier protein
VQLVWRTPDDVPGADLDLQVVHPLAGDPPAAELICDADNATPDWGAEGPANDAGELHPLRSPMPGTVIAVDAEPGRATAAGQALITVEAMKMEHTLTAPGPALVSEVLVGVGDRVGLDEVLVRFGAAGEE